MEKISKIAILTSGGDAPGMNKALETICFRARKMRIIPYVVIDGYKGLCNGDIREANQQILEFNANLAGSIIYCNRFSEFKESEFYLKAIENIKKFNIDILFVLGGNGSYLGAKLLSKNGVKVICLPCTIDNDIKFTEYSIGFDSALNVIVEAIDNLKSTAKSHGNLYLIELMGRKCSHLTIAAAYATKVDYVITRKNILSKEQILSLVEKIKKTNKREVIILIAEKIYDNQTLHEIANYIENETKISSKVHIMGFIQRGAKPTATERYNATIMGEAAIDAIIHGEYNIAIGKEGNSITKTNLDNDFYLDQDQDEIMKFLLNINNH